MSLNFALNIGMMFPPNTPLQDRLKRTSDLGFTAIEIAFPYSWRVEEWRAALSATPLKVVLINTPLGPNKEPGLSSTKHKTKDFLAGLEEGVRYCEALGCDKLHIMSGLHEESDREVFISNMRAAGTLLKAHGVTGVIECISEGVISNYYLNGVARVVGLVRELRGHNVGLQFDVFHLNMMGKSDDEVIELFDRNVDVVEHVQVAQTPNRNELNVDGGVDYVKILNHIKESKFQGFIGLELKPSCFDALTEFISFLKQF